MDAERIAIAEKCLHAAHSGVMAFPDIVGTLIAAGFEGYQVDYRRNVATYYLPDGDNVDVRMPMMAGTVAAAFDRAGIAAAVRDAQANAPGYSYDGFCRQVARSGCAGYLVSFLRRRVVYYGRTADTHVELFPQ